MKRMIVFTDDDGWHTVRAMDGRTWTSSERPLLRAQKSAFVDEIQGRGGIVSPRSDRRERNDKKQGQGFERCAPAACGVEAFISAISAQFLKLRRSRVLGYLELSFGFEGVDLLLFLEGSSAGATPCLNVIENPCLSLFALRA